MSLLHDLEIPAYALSGQKPVIAGDACLQYTHNGLDGNFYLGTESLGREVWMRPIAWRWDSSERWSRRKQNWLDVAFISATNLLSVISLKKQSAINLYAEILELQPKGVLLEAVWMILESESVEVSVIDEGGSYDDSYNAVKVRHSGYVSEAQIEQYYAWAESLGNQFDWNIMGEVS